MVGEGDAVLLSESIVTEVEKLDIQRGAHSTRPGTVGGNRDGGVIRDGDPTVLVMTVEKKAANPTTTQWL